MTDEPIFWAVMIFFGVPLSFVAWTMFLILAGRTKGEPDTYPLGDATDTPRTLLNIRRANWRK